MSDVDPQIDQTSEDVVTGVEVVDGVLTLRRHDGTTEEITLATLIGTPRANAAQAAVATTPAALTSYGFTEAQANGIVALLNEIRTALVEANIIKGSA